MQLQMWFLYHHTDGLMLDPRYENLLPELRIDTKNVTHKFTLPTEDCWIYATVNVSDKELKGLDIILTHPIEEHISTEKLSENIKAIRTQLKTMANEKVKSKFEKPTNLFITDMNWNLINATLDLGKYPLLIGPKGCGKTQTAQDLAKQRGMKYYGINCGSIFKPKTTLVGQMQAKEGSTYLLESEFLKHFTDDCEEGVLIFLDEISRIPPAAANYFMTILDRIQSYIYVEEEGRQVKRGKNVVFIAAANFGYEYSDTRNLDGALIDRFIKFMIDYLPEKEEVALIQQRVPTANLKDIQRLVNYAKTCREAESLRVAVSTRQLIDMSEYLPLGFDTGTIFENIFLNLFVNGSTDDRKTVEQMFDAIK